MAPYRNPRSFRWLVFTSRLFLAGGFILGHACGVPSLAAAEALSKVSKSLNSVDAAERIDALRTEIAYHDELYFKKAAPVISDFAYDQLKLELAALEQAFPNVAGNGDSSMRVGDDRSGAFPTGRHRARMLSLNKAYTEAELRAFDARLMRQLRRRDLDYVVEPKFDGLAISVTYENGQLVRAITRGNGDEGDDVTVKAKAIRSLPQLLRAKSSDGTVNPLPGLIELRGEVFITDAEFARLNRERENAGEPLFAHPRNLAAGTLKQADVVDGRKLDIVFYGLGACEPAQSRPASQQELLRQLRAWGLPTVDAPRPVRGADAMCAAVRAVGKERAGFGFPTDGAVVKLDDGALQDQVGVTAQAPLWAIAFKFAPIRATTQLRGITWQVGRTGLLTPVAELAPVRLGGATVARASLSNRDQIARLDLHNGDFVFVEKAGEVIPAVSGVDRTHRTPGAGPCVIPNVCPACHVTLVESPGEVALRCPNHDCPAQVKRRVGYFASAACVDIKGLGPATVDRLVAKGSVKNIADLYRLRREDLLTGKGAGEVSADRLLAAIDKSRHAELWRFIRGLGIPQIGEAASRDLARHFGTLEALARLPENDLAADDHRSVPGLSAAARSALSAYFAQLENRMLVSDLIDLGVRPAPAPREAVSTAR